MPRPRPADVVRQGDLFTAMIFTAVGFAALVPNVIPVAAVACPAVVQARR